MNLKTGTSIAALAIAGFLAWQIYKKGKTIADSAGSALSQVNPLNPNNVIKQTVDKVVQSVTGDDQATLGGKLWELTHPGQVAAESSLSGPVALTADPAKLLQQWTAADQEDAEAGALMRGLPLWTPSDQEDADLGAALTAGAYVDYSKLARGARRSG